MTTPIDKSSGSSNARTPPQKEVTPTSQMAETAAKAEIASDKVLSKESSQSPPKIHKGDPVPPSHTSTISTRVTIPPNFKSLPIVLQLNIIEQLTIRELETLKVSLGKGNASLLEKVNARLSDLKLFPLLANLLNREDLPQAKSSFTFDLNRLPREVTSNVLEHLSLSEIGKFSKVSKGMNQETQRKLRHRMTRETFGKREIEHILKEHPNWDASIVKEWKLSHSQKIWLLKVYEIHQKSPISVMRWVNLNKERIFHRDPQEIPSYCLENRGRITTELTQKYEDIKKRLKL